MMLSHKDYSFRHLFVRSLLPSPISGLLCVFFGVGLVGVYLLLQSVSVGTSLPQLFDGEWSVAYTNHVVQPLLSLFSNLTVNKILVLLLWGALGLVAYLLVEGVAGTYKGWRAAQHNIRITDRAIVRHPGLYSFLAEALWRLTVLVVFAFIFIFGVQPVLHQLGSVGPKTVLGDLAGAATVEQLALLASKLALLAHACVVFLRLFLARVRLFGDDPL